MSIAYALRAEYDGTVSQVLAVDDNGEPTETREVPVFTGGVIAIDLTRDLNIADALAEGNGRIVADDSDHTLISALDAYPALKRVEHTDESATVDPYEQMSAADVKAEFDARGLEAAGRTTKAERADALRAHDAALAHGDTELAAAIARGENTTAGDTGQED